MKRAIVTYAVGEHEKLLEVSLPTFQSFADRHGYDLIVGNKLTDRPPAWNKVPLLINALKSYESAIWFDADLVVVNNEKDIEVSPDCTHALVRHFAFGSEVPNSGMWFLRPQCIELLEKMWELEVFMNHGWWEQAALLTMMGYCVPPEESEFDETKCRCVFETKWANNVQFLRVEWNSHPNYRSEGPPRIVHCSYQDKDVRIETMKRLIEFPDYEYSEWPSKVKKDGDVSTGK